MRVWIDLANSPHVPFFAPVVRRFEDEGWEVLITARAHAQTLALAEAQWPALTVVGTESPPGRVRKALSIAHRAGALKRFAQRTRPNVALSHASYAQVVAARAAGVPSVTLMDYEHQPANHLSFRVANSVVVPEAFPVAAIRKFGAAHKTTRYAGFKEELYLAGFEPDPEVLVAMGIDPGDVLVVMRPPPQGALYHQQANPWFDAVLGQARVHPGVRVILLPRTQDQRRRYSEVPEVTIPAAAIDALSLLAHADVAIGAGGTMNRESALLGVPTFTTFRGNLAAVDQRLMEMGLLHDLRFAGTIPRLEKRAVRTPAASSARAGALLETIVERTAALARPGPRRFRLA